MRATFLGLIVGSLVAGLILTTGTGHRDVFAQRLGEVGSPATMSEGLVALSGPVVDGQQLIVLIDKQRSTMATYHIAFPSGQCSLRSVRNFRWDLEMDEFNGAEPSPEKIQALLESR